MDGQICYKGKKGIADKKETIVWNGGRKEGWSIIKIWKERGTGRKRNGDNMERKGDKEESFRKM